MRNTYNDTTVFALIFEKLVQYDTNLGNTVFELFELEHEFTTF